MHMQHYATRSLTMSLSSVPVPLSLEISLTLSSLKLNNKAPLWNSTRVPSTSIQNAELQRVASKSFSTTDYYGDLIRQTKSSQDSLQAPIIGISTISILSSALLLPALDIPAGVKNILGLVGLLGPLLFIGLNIISPQFREMFQAQFVSSKVTDKEDRISYHEAGHFLAGYLLGIPVVSYDISGERDAGTSIEVPANNEAAMTSLELSGALLVIAMSGVVAETLRFGNTCGGSEDFSIAFSIMRELKVPAAKREGYLRHAVLNSLKLLQLHRDSLDEVAFAMKERKSPQACFEAIESGRTKYL